jgi:hypothetical protein
MLDRFPAIVLASVIDHDHLYFASQIAKKRNDPVAELLQGFFTVVYRDDDRKYW